MIMNLKELRREIPYKRKIQAKPKQKDWVWKKWVCVAYIDSRDVQEVLDDVCGIEWWADKYYECKWKLFCEISIKVWGEWVWKSDSWALEDNDNVDKETTSKWESSDAFKRAGVKRWIGRFLYNLPTQWIDNDEYTKNKWDLTTFINNRMWNKKITPPKAKKVFGEAEYKALVDKKDDYVDSVWVLGVLDEKWYTVNKEYENKITDLYK